MANIEWRRWLGTGLLASVLMYLPATVVGTETVDLNKALSSAYLNNPDLTVGQAQLRAVDEQVPQALAGWRPRIFLNGDVTGSDSETDSRASSNTSKSASIDVTQSLYAGGATVAGIRLAEHNVRAQRARLTTLEQQVLLDAVDAYTVTFRDRSVLQLAKNNSARLARQLQATRDRFEVGEVARTDVAQAEAALASAEADIQQATADLASSTSAYRDIIGMEPEELTKPVELASALTSLQEALEIAKNSPDIAAAEFDLRSSRASVDVVQADLLPSLDLSGSLGYTDDPSDSVDWQRQASIGLDLAIPLYQGGAVYSRVREAKQTVRVQQGTLEGVIRGVQRNVTSSWELLAAARAATAALESEVRANRIALEGVEQEALVGQRTVLDVLDAEQDLFQSQVDLVSAEQTVVLASAQLKASIGQLTIIDLDLDTPTYDPEAYYNQQRSRLFGVALD